MEERAAAMIEEICKLTEEVESGEILDVVKLYHAFKEPRSKEADSQLILSITYPTSELRRFLEAVAAKVEGKRNDGIFISSGGYGSGKSHALLVLYHLARLGPQASDWLHRWGVKGVLPSTRVAAVNLVSEAASSLWEHLFERAGHPELIPEVRNWPSLDQWKSLAREGPLVLLIDELEDWLDGLRSESRGPNKTALYNLAEAATEPGCPLVAVLVVYGRKPHLYSDAFREHPPIYNFATTQDRERIVIHRLIESFDRRKAEAIIKRYLEAYRAVPDRLPSQRGRWDSLEDEMLSLFPFHPHFLKNAFEVYGSASHYQGARGTIYLGASLLRESKSKPWELVTAGCVSPLFESVALDLRQLNITLVGCCEEDLRQRLSAISLAEPLLSTALFFSFIPQRPGATAEDIAFANLSPETNINDIDAQLKDVLGKAVYLDEVEGRYRIVEEPVLRKVIEQRARDLLATPQGIAKTKAKFLSEMREIIGANSYFVEEVVPDSEAPLKLVFASKSLSTSEVLSVTRGKTWPNTIVVMQPKAGLTGDLLQDEDFLMTLARVMVAETLSVDARREQERQKLAAEFRRTLEAELKGNYGIWCKVIRQKRDTGVEHSIRYIDVEPTKARIEATLDRHYDVSAIKEAIREFLEEKRQAGCKVRDISEMFRRFLGLPVIRADSQWQVALRALANESREVVVRTGRTLYPYHAPLPEILQEDWEVWLQPFAPPPPPPPGIKEAAERRLRSARESGVRLNNLLAQVQQEGAQDATAENLLQVMDELIVEAKAVVEDLDGEVRSPEGGAIPHGLQLDVLIGWHRDFSPADDRQARKRVLDILDEKEEVGLGTLTNTLHGEGIADRALRYALRRLINKNRAVIVDAAGNSLFAVPDELSDTYKVRRPAVVPPPPPPREIVVDTELCGSPEVMLSLLRDRVPEEGQVTKVEIRAEPSTVTTDPVFGYDWPGSTSTITHQLAVQFPLPTTKAAFLSHIENLKDRLGGMKLRAKVTVRVRGYGA